MTTPLSEAIVRARTEADADARPRQTRALAKWPVRLSEIEIAGLSCQVIEPVEGDHRSTMLYFFGGGYVTGSPENDLSITAPLASLGSMRIIAPRYGLSPEHPFPIAIEQAIKVYRALITDPSLTLCAESAGGGLSLAVLQKAQAEGMSMPKRVALLSPWCDLREEATVRSEGVNDPLLDAEALRFFASNYLDGSPAENPDASPLLATFGSDWPETLLTTGSNDRLRHAVHELAAKIILAGGLCEIIDVPGMHHVFEAYDENPEALETLKRIADFLEPKPR